MDSHNRRQDFRIDDILPMSDGMITRHEYEHQRQFPGMRSRQNSIIQNMIGKDISSQNLQSIVDQDMAIALETLDAKLNYLIGVNMLNDANRTNLKERPVNLSVTGVSFRTKERYSKGDYASIAIMLPSFPPIILELVANVTWVNQENKNLQHVGMQFSYRNNDEETNMTKYVFQRHRENIRLKIKESLEE